VVSGGMFRGADGGRRFCRFQDFQLFALRQIRRAGVCSTNRQLSNSIGTDSPFFWIFGLSRFDVSPANAPFSRVCAPPTHLTRFLGGRAPRLSNFSDSGGLGGLGGYAPGGRWGAPVLQISGIFDFGSPANPSGRRLRYKSSTLQEYRTTLSRISFSTGLPDVTSRWRTLRSRGCVPPRPI
jgi:hypothetical protein